MSFIKVTLYDGDNLADSRSVAIHARDEAALAIAIARYLEDTKKQLEFTQAFCREASRMMREGAEENGQTGNGDLEV